MKIARVPLKDYEAVLVKKLSEPYRTLYTLNPTEADCLPLDQ